MLSFDFPQKCTTCQGYKTMPFSWSGTAQPQMCTCPKVSLSWECHRCKKINAPWKASCDCTPSPLSSTPTCNIKKFKYSDPSPFPKMYNSDGSECNEV